MKRILGILICTLLIAGTSSVYAQIYIDTGNPEIEEYKDDNPNAVEWGTEYKDNKPPASESVGTANPGENTNTNTKPANTNTNNNTTTKPVTQPTNTKPATTTTPTTTTTTPTTAKPISNEKLVPVSDELPPFAEPGKCYARCYVPDQYEWIETEVLDKPATYKTQVIPATYETVFDTVVVKPETKKVEVVPAEYETITEKVMVSPSTTKWEKTMGDENCLSNDPKDCQVMCLVEVPAVYKTQTRKVVKTPSYTREIVIPAEYKIVPKKVLVDPSKTIQIETPATYKKQMSKKLVKAGGYQEWREVLCGDQLTVARIQQIQVALKAQGYDPGPIDNILGPQTRAALIQYQKDKGLPQGNLNMETLKSLGVE